MSHSNEYTTVSLYKMNVFNTTKCIKFLPGPFTKRFGTLLFDYVTIQ